jgi:hypothetical protein
MGSLIRERPTPALRERDPFTTRLVRHALACSRAWHARRHRHRGTSGARPSWQLAAETDPSQHLFRPPRSIAPSLGIPRPSAVRTVAPKPRSWLRRSWTGAVGPAAPKNAAEGCPGEMTVIEAHPRGRFQDRGVSCRTDRPSRERAIPQESVCQQTVAEVAPHGTSIDVHEAADGRIGIGVLSKRCKFPSEVQPRSHRVVDPFTAEGIDRPGGITDHDCSAGRGFAGPGVR